MGGVITKVFEHVGNAIDWVGSKLENLGIPIISSIGKMLRQIVAIFRIPAGLPLIISSKVAQFERDYGKGQLLIY